MLSSENNTRTSWAHFSWKIKRKIELFTSFGEKVIHNSSLEQKSKKRLRCWKRKNNGPIVLIFSNLSRLFFFFCSIVIREQNKCSIEIVLEMKQKNKGCLLKVAFSSSYKIYNSYHSFQKSWRNLCLVQNLKSRKVWLLVGKNLWKQ